MIECESCNHCYYFFVPEGVPVEQGCCIYDSNVDDPVMPCETPEDDANYDLIFSTTVV